MSHVLVLALGVLIGVGGGWWAALWHRDRVPRGEQWIIRRIYKHVDEFIGATKNENQERADRRRKIIEPRFKGWRRLLWLIPKKARIAWADYRDPIPRIGQGTNPLPEIERMAVYVHVEFNYPPTRRWLVRPPVYQLWNVQAVTLVWTSEASPLRGHEWPRTVGTKVVQALLLASVDQLDIHMDTDNGCVRYSRKAPEPERPTTVPVGVNADA